jgi:hypothetical protein
MLVMTYLRIITPPVLSLADWLKACPPNLPSPHMQLLIVD